MSERANNFVRLPILFKRGKLDENGLEKRNGSVAVRFRELVAID
jgi:hypothetical protein